MDKTSYALGMIIGNQLLDIGGARIDVGDFSRAIEDTLSGRKPQLTPDEAQSLVRTFMSQAEVQRQEEARQIGAKAKAEGEAFLSENKKRPGVQTTQSGLQYEVLRQGGLRRPKATDSVVCHYEGRLIDGTVFDSSYRRNQPATFPLNGVIKGWTEGLQLMGEGAKYRLFLPYQLAYGSTGAGHEIPPYAALVFDVELINVV